jgi:hypothetical protein
MQELRLQFDPANPKVMWATLGPLRPDVYTVRWQSLSADDDDYADGSYQLTVLNPDGSPPNATTEPIIPDDNDGGGSGSTMLIVSAVAAVVLVGVAVVFVTRSRRPA